MAKLCNSKVYERENNIKRVCPAWVIYSMPFVLLGGTVGVCMSCLNGSWLACLIVLLVGGVWSVFVDIYFDMYENCRIEFNPSGVVYRYDLNRSVMPSSDVTTTITVKDLSRVRVKGNYVILEGTLLRKAPLKREKQVKKVRVPIDFKERDEIIGMLNERVGQ